MQTNPQLQKGHDGALSTLNVTIEALNLAEEVCSIAPAKAAFGSVVSLLTMIKVRFLPSFGYRPPPDVLQESMVNEEDRVDLGLSCAEVCKTLDRVLKGRRLDELGQSVLEAIQQLTT